MTIENEDDPYAQPRFRTSHKATSPDGRLTAEIASAFEVSMSEPTSGTLRISNGLVVEKCNPSFLWSDDSRYLAVPQWKYWYGLLPGQHLLVIDASARRAYRSPWRWGVFQPERFASGTLTVIFRPHYKPERIDWRIPDDLASFEPA